MTALTVYVYIVRRVKTFSSHVGANDRHHGKASLFVERQKTFPLSMKHRYTALHYSQLGLDSERTMFRLQATHLVRDGFVRDVSARATPFLAFLVVAYIFLWPQHAAADVSPMNGLIGFWSGNCTARDSSPVHNDGTFTGAYAMGAPGGGCAFDLGTGSVYIPNNAVYDSFQTDPGWTVGFWFNTTEIPPDSTNDVFLGQDNGSGYQPKWFIDYGYTVFGSNSDFVWHVNDYNTERLFLVSQPVALPHGWNQLTVTVNNSTHFVDFYLNGVDVGTAGSPLYVLQTTAQLVFGGAEGFTYHGLMSDVAIYDRSLSPSEVKELVGSVATPEPRNVGTVPFALIVGAIVARRRRTVPFVRAPK